MHTLCEILLEELKTGRSVVLATVCKRRGSAPRGVGAAMVLLENGTQRGTIGGGAVEYAVTQEAVAMLGKPDSKMVEYRLNANEIAAEGMTCGGYVSVLLQGFVPAKAPVVLLQELMTRRDAGDPVALVRYLMDGRVTVMEVRQDAGKKAYLSDDGSLLIEPIAREPRAIVFGGGHVSQKLVPLLSYVGFRCYVFEDREAFADKALFPNAEKVLLGEFSRIAENLTVTPEDYAIVMTRGHQADYEVLKQLLKTDVVYIGCIGSRRKTAMTRERLIGDGFSEEDFRRIHTPIGLDIGAETPEEIGVSVAAELIFHRAHRG